MDGTDWRTAELDYRAGIMSIGMICKVHGISRSTLMNKVAQEGWSRDLMSQVRAEVNERVYMNRQREEGDKDHVSLAAQVVIDTIYAHRKDIGHLRSTLTRALGKINTILDYDPDAPDAQEKAMAALRMLQTSALFGKSQGVVSALDTIASAYQRVIAMERQAFGLEMIVPPTNDSGSATGGTPIANVQVYLPANHRDPVT